MLKRDPFEAEALTVFRLFLGVQWLLLTLALLDLLLRQRLINDYLTLLSWGLTTFLLAYLLWPWLARMLGRFYLPFALLILSAGPVFNQALTTAILLRHGVLESAALVDVGTFYIALLLPLLLISLQYNVRIVFLFAGGTALLSVMLAILLTPHHKLIVATTILRSLDRFALFALIGVIIALLSQVRRKQQRELQRKNAQLVHYATTQEQLVVSQERNRMARELHDTLAHTLSGLNVQLKAVEVLCETDIPAAQQALKKMQVLTSEGLHESRRALHSLRANPIEELGLILALQRLTEQAVQCAGFKASLDLPTRLPSISPDVEQHLYRIVEEALNNVVRHANAKHVSLSLHQNSAELYVMVSDDGVGFDTAQVFVHAQSVQHRGDEFYEQRQHFGLMGIRERVMLMDGTFDIRSKPQQGTTICVCVDVL